MRYAALVISMFLLIQPANAGPTPEIDPRASLNVVQQWIYNTGAKPDYAHVPAAVRVLLHAQSLRSRRTPASISASSPARSDRTRQAEHSSIALSGAAQDEWVIVRAIAYSGLPDWRNLLRRVAPKMPGRRVMIDSSRRHGCQP